MHYPIPRNRYKVADHYNNGHVPGKTTILKYICNHVNLNPKKIQQLKSHMNVQDQH